MSKDALKLALEALENSYDYVAEEADRVEQMYGNYLPRQGKINGLRQDERKHMEAITAIKQALEQPVQPLTWLKTIETRGGFGKFVEAKPNEKGAKPVYTAPPAQPAPVQEPVAWDRPIIYTPPHMAPPAAQRPRVGLTDDEIEEMANDFEEGYVFLYRSFARAIEAAHGIKENT
jgi:hypothetical protein